MGRYGQHEDAKRFRREQDDRHDQATWADVRDDDQLAMESWLPAFEARGATTATLRPCEETGHEGCPERGCPGPIAGSGVASWCGLEREERGCRA